MNSLILAKDYINQGEHGLAIGELKKIAALDTENDETHVLLGLTYQKINEFDLALKEFEIARKLNIKNTEIFILIGNVYNQKGDFDSAVKSYLESINTNAKNKAQARFEIGKIYENKAKYIEAAREYEQSLKIEYKNDLLIRLIQIYRLIGKWESVKERVLNHLKSTPEDDIFTRNLLLNELEIAQKKTILSSKIRSFTVTLTNKCNLNCSMCVAKQINWEAPRQVASEIIELLPYLEHIMWQGGEVFLVDYFNDILEETRHYPHIKQLIITNGLLLTEDLIARLIIQPELVLTISVDGVTKDIYESIRRGAKFEQLIRNIRLINSMRKQTKSKLALHLNVTIMKSNYHQTLDFLKFAKEYEFDSVLFAPASENTCGGENLFYDRNQDKEAMRSVTKMIAEAKDRAAELGVILFNRVPTLELPNNSHKNEKKNIKDEINNKGFLCYAPWQRLYINWDGNVFPDCMCTKPYDIGIGNVKRNSIKEIWNNEGMQMYRRKIIEHDYVDLCNPDCVTKMIPERYLKLNK